VPFFRDDALTVVGPTTDPDRLLAYWEVVLCWIEDGGGWVASPAYAWPVRFEAKPDSELPKLFRQRGYSVVYTRSAERFMPVTETVQIFNAVTTVERPYLAPGTVEVWTVDLPK
jgi:hypothetical protein